jgi:serine protease
VLSLPLPDWERILFGRGKLASPLMYSALIPAVAALFALKWRSLRPVVAGLSLGFAGFLLYAAWAKAPGIAYLPFTFLARPWLVVNGLLAALMCRAMLRRESRR